MKRFAFLLLPALAAATPACQDETIVLASVPATDGGTGRPMTRCSSPSDCPPGLFCDKHGCGDDVGVCEALPAFCTDETPRPVCGCDGITYMDDCLRHQAGVSRAAEGECTAGAATPCGGALGDCPNGTVCVQLLPPTVDPRTCPREIHGTCWGAPPTCPPVAPTLDRWNGCGRDGDRCVDTCTAIKSGIPHVKAVNCP